MGFLLLNKLQKSTRKTCFDELALGLPKFIGLPEPIERIHLIVFDWVRFLSSIEHNQMNWDRLSSIWSEIELTESLVFHVVGLPNAIELNPWIDLHWVRFSNGWFTMPGIRSLYVWLWYQSRQIMPWRMVSRAYTSEPHQNSLLLGFYSNRWERKGNGDRSYSFEAVGEGEGGLWWLDYWWWQRWFLVHVTEDNF